MLTFPNSKINLGLHVTEKRPDGYHNIETVFYPVNWWDALEIIEHKDQNKKFDFSCSGLPVEGPPEDNLVYKAWQMIAAEKELPPIKVHLHKNIPMGAGLGGGSSDAAHFINLLDRKFGLNYSDDAKIKMASRLGSDCAFFIRNTPRYAQGKGDEFSGVRVDLSMYYILLVYPGIYCSTKEVYSGVKPKKPLRSLRSFIEFQPVSAWKELMVNDFEPGIFKKYPEIMLLKEKLYSSGAVYASMSGSGSAVFGIFEHEPPLTFPASYRFCLQKPVPKIL